MALGDTIRLDQRATMLLEDANATDSNDRRRYVLQEVNQAHKVINAQDKVIKDLNQPSSRSATFAEIRESRLVQG